MFDFNENLSDNVAEIIVEKRINKQKVVKHLSESDPLDFYEETAMDTMRTKFRGTADLFPLMDFPEFFELGLCEAMLKY